MADEPGRHAVLVAAHHYLRIPIDPRRQSQRGVEPLGRQRPQQRLLQGPVDADVAGPITDAGIVGAAPDLQQRVEFFDRVHHRHRDAVVAAEPAALAPHATLLVAALMAGAAVERVEAVIRLNTTQRSDSTRVRPNSTRDTAGLRLS
jgi:hypothetical protein